MFNRTATAAKDLLRQATVTGVAQAPRSQEGEQLETETEPEGMQLNVVEKSDSTILRDEERLNTQNDAVKAAVLRVRAQQNSKRVISLSWISRKRF